MPEEPQTKDINEGKFFAVISYISFLCMIGLLLKKDNAFAVYHAKQGLVLFVLEVLVFIFSIVPVLGWLLKIAGLIVFTVLSLWGILHAFQGNCGRIPVISGLAEKVIL